MRGISGTVGLGSGPFGFSGCNGIGASSEIVGLFGDLQPVEEEDNFCDGFIVSGQISDFDGFRPGLGFYR